MYYTKIQSSSTTNRCIYRSNRYIESIHSTKLPGGEGDMPDTRLHIRNEGPLKGYYAQVYKLKDPTPIGYREGTGSMGAFIILSRELAPY